MIVGVAIRSEKVIIMLPKPNRHCDCFRYLAELGINCAKSKIGRPAESQGFYTHTGKYLNRRQVYKYVKRIKQTICPEANKYLFSEDLW